MRNLLRAPFAMRFLQLSLALGYFLSAWAKARGNTWHDGTAIALSLRIEDLQRYVAPEWLFEQAVLLNLFTWATLAFEATFGVLVWNRRLRPWVIGTGVAFHLGIDVFLDIGFFSIAIFLAYLAFVPDEVANRIVGRFDKRALEPGPAGRPTEPRDELDARRRRRGAWGAEAPPEPPTREAIRLRRSPTRSEPAEGRPYSSEELAAGERRRLTDAVEPAEEDGDGPWVVADAVAGAVHDPQLGVAVGVDEDSGVEHRDEVVVAAVDDEERAGRDLRRAGDRAHLAGARGSTRRRRRGTSGR